MPGPGHGCRAARFATAPAPRPRPSLVGRGPRRRERRGRRSRRHRRGHRCQRWRQVDVPSRGGRRERDAPGRTVRRSRPPCREPAHSGSHPLHEGGGHHPGRGKLREELGRLSELVDACTPTSLVLLNETLSSTNEREGAEIARQLVTAMTDAAVVGLVRDPQSPICRRLAAGSAVGDPLPPRRARRRWRAVVPAHQRSAARDEPWDGPVRPDHRRCLTPDMERPRHPICTERPGRNAARGGGVMKSGRSFLTPGSVERAARDGRTYRPRARWLCAPDSMRSGPIRDKYFWAIDRLHQTTPQRTGPPTTACRDARNRCADAQRVPTACGGMVTDPDPDRGHTVRGRRPTPWRTCGPDRDPDRVS